MSELKVNKLSPRSGTDVTLGDSGDTFTIPAGATITNNGTANGFDTDTNDKVKVSSNDTTAGFLNGKLVAGTNITLTEGSDGGNETLTIASAAQAITATANGSDNRIATYSAATALNGEANLTFDGSTLALTGNMTVSGTVDGQDVAAVATTASAALPKAGGTMTGNLVLGDNVKALFGTGNDLEIYHNGSSSVIEDTGTGNLIIKATSELQVKNSSDAFAAVFNAGGGSDIYHAGSVKLSTTSGGINVTGAITVNNAALAGGIELFKVVRVNSTSTYTPTSGTSFVRVYALGGGGGAGSLNYSNGENRTTAGGAGGNTSVKTYTASELGATAAVTIGAGGSGGSSGGNGSIGGNTTFNPAGSGATLTGYGGEYSFGNSNQSYLVGAQRNEYSGSTGNSDYVIYGVIGRKGMGDQQAGTTVVKTSGVGGTSYFGRGGQGRWESSTGSYAGISADANGGGGGGGALLKNTSGNIAGGAGGSGTVVIEEYK